MSAAVLDQLLALPKKRKMEIAAQLWLSVAEEENVAVPARHRQVLKERLAAYRSGASKPIAHAELMRRLRAK